MDSIEIIIGFFIVALVIVTVLVIVLLQLGIITEHKGVPTMKNPSKPPPKLIYWITDKEERPKKQTNENN